MSARVLLYKPVYWESVILSLMCLVDAWLTILLVAHGWAVEANPLMAFFLSQSVPAFVLAKLLFFLPAIIACEYLRHKNPRFALLAVRVGLFGYMAVYVIGDLAVNHVI